MFGKLVLLPYLLLLAVHLPWCASQFPEGGVLFANEYAEVSSNVARWLQNTQTTTSLLIMHAHCTSWSKH